MTPEQLNEARAVWQPIATAPKDGRWMLICGPRVMPVMAHWNDAPEQWQRFNCCDKGIEPTHWMPLPAPPTILQEHPNG